MLGLRGSAAWSAVARTKVRARKMRFFMGVLNEGRLVNGLGFHLNGNGGGGESKSLTGERSF